MFLKYSIRIKFAKKGRAKYISHLDLLRCIQRAVRRIKLPIAYSNGFHPHMQIVFIAALSLGFESETEIVEIQLTEQLDLQDIYNLMKSTMPEGLEILNVYYPVNKLNELGFADYSIFINSENPDLLLNQWKEFLLKPEIIVEKKSKRSVKMVDILPQIICLDATTKNNGLSLILRLPTSNSGSLNPTLVTETFFNYNEIIERNYAVCRMKFLTIEKKEFF